MQNNVGSEELTCLPSFFTKPTMAPKNKSVQPPNRSIMQKAVSAKFVFNNPEIKMKGLPMLFESGTKSYLFLPDTVDEDYYIVCHHCLRCNKKEVAFKLTSFARYHGRKCAHKGEEAEANDDTGGAKQIQVLVSDAANYQEDKKQPAMDHNKDSSEAEEESLSEESEEGLVAGKQGHFDDDESIVYLGTCPPP